MELKRWEVILASSVEQVKFFDGLFREQRSDVAVFLYNFAVEAGDIVDSERVGGIGRKGHNLCFTLDIVKILDFVEWVL